MKYQDRTIKFAHHFVNDILKKAKTRTYRLGEKYNFLHVGDTIQVENSSNGNIFAKIEISNKSYTTFGKLDNERQERFKTYYDRKDISSDEKVIIIQFNVIEVYA